MKEKMKAFFDGTGKEIAEHLGSGASILITLGKASYTMKVTEERAIEIGNNGKGSAEIEIITQESVMNDLLSSSSVTEYREKMLSYIVKDQGPAVKILMERTEKNATKFIRFYADFLRRMHFL